MTENNCQHKHLRIGKIYNLTGRSTCHKCGIMFPPYFPQAKYLGHVDGDGVFEAISPICCIERGHIHRYQYFNCCDQELAEFFENAKTLEQVGQRDND